MKSITNKKSKMLKFINKNFKTKITQSELYYLKNDKKFKRKLKTLIDVNLNSNSI